MVAGRRPGRRRVTGGGARSPGSMLRKGGSSRRFPERLSRHSPGRGRKPRSPRRPAPPAAGPGAAGYHPSPRARPRPPALPCRRWMGLLRAAAPRPFLRSEAGVPRLRPCRRSSSPFSEPLWLRLAQRIVLREKATSFSLPLRGMYGEGNRNGPFLQTGVPVQWVHAPGKSRLRAVIAPGVCGSPRLRVEGWSPCGAGAAWVYRKTVLNEV